MSSTKKFYTLLVFNIILLSIVITSFVFFSSYLKGQILGISHLIKLDKNNYSISANENLKHFYEPNPNTIISDQPEWLKEKVTNIINSDSLNERYEYEINKPDSTYRIITLGDSFTYGLYVNTEENFSEILEDKLNLKLKCKDIPKFEVINLGVAGYDLSYAIERFRKRGNKYNPDLVIWLINFWNFEIINELQIPLYKELRKEGLKDYNYATGKFEVAEKAIDAINKLSR